MRGQRGAIGSFSESDISLDSLHNSPSNRLSDYISLNSTNEEGQDVSMWNVGEPPASILSLSDHVNNGHHGSSFPQGSHPECVPRSITMNPSNSIGFKSSSSFEAYRGSTASSSSFSEPYDLDGCRLSRKRKAAELSIGQSSSRIGSSNMFQGTEGGSTTWHTIAENPLVANSTRSDEIIPRLGLSVGGDSPRQQDPLRANSNNRQSDVLAPYPSLRLNPVDFRSPPLAATPENSSSHQGQPVRIPASRRNLQSTSRWSRNSSSRANRTTFSGDRNELDSISDHPLFAQPNHVSNAENEVVTASSRAGPSSRATPSPAAPNSAVQRSSPHFSPRRLSAFLRRASSATDLESGGGPNSNILPRITPSVCTSASVSQDSGSAPVAGIQGPHQPHSRSSVLFGRQINGAFRFPHLSRSMAFGSEGRGRLVSEIRNVLDLMRRGEPLQFEDLMILDQSVFYGIADIHDRHRDMRLDIDNMSYEELLALGDRIGNVNTGLTEEAISKHLNEKQYMTETRQPDGEPCCICQEEYDDREELGTLECGHEFHRGCIKQWLQRKNLCPICKSTGLTAT